jgi:hypothetical protein
MSTIGKERTSTVGNGKPGLLAVEHAEGYPFYSQPASLHSKTRFHGLLLAFLFDASAHLHTAQARPPHYQAAPDLTMVVPVDDYYGQTVPELKRMASRGRQTRAQKMAYGARV